MTRLVKLWPWIAILLAALLIVLLPAPTVYTAPVDRTIRIEASRFQYAPSTLEVNPGDRVTIELVAQDVVHGLSIDGYDVNMAADPGQTARATFVADKPGVFRFRCTVTCGNMHPFMIGKFQVGSSTLLWRAAGLALLSIIAGIWKIRA